MSTRFRIVRPAPDSARRAVLLLRTCGALLLLALAGCDPCFGTFACTDDRIAAEGRLIWHLTADDAQGVEVRFVRTGGARLESDTLYAQSAEDGSFRLQAAVIDGGAGAVEGSLQFRPPPPFDAFVFGVPAVRLIPVRTRGDARFLGTWGVGPLRGLPHISYVGEVRDAAANVALPGVEVEFRRTGGIEVSPAGFVVVSDAGGRFPLLMTPAGEGEVVGDLLIRPPPPLQPKTVTGLRLPTLRGVNDIRLAGVWWLEQ